MASEGEFLKEYEHVSQSVFRELPQSEGYSHSSAEDVSRDVDCPSLGKSLVTIAETFYSFTFSIGK